MAPAKLVDRVVRPQHASDDENTDEYESQELLSGSISSEDEGSRVDGDMSSGDEHVAEQQITTVSFGALQQAQDSLSRKRKRESDDNNDQDRKLEALRARLKQIKSSKETPKNALPTRDLDAEGESESDSGPEEEGANTKSRSSKHAPMEQSSRKPVTRMRTVIEVPKRTVRDPRFDAFSGNTAQPSNTEQKYSFLVDYQKAEIAELQAAMKQSKSEEEKETLKRKIVSMQNRLKAKENAAREQEVLRKHRKEEKERVEQGKTPFFLKRKDVKERALVEKFKEMKGKDREKLVERRRKKEGQREKKRMPDARRGVA